MSVIEQIIQATLAGDVEKSSEMAQKVLDDGMDPMEAIEQGYSKAMSIMGEKFGKLEIYLPELLMAADAMKAGFEILKPHLAKDERAAPQGTVVIGTIQGDLHDLGKNIVRTMLESSGFAVHDLGCDVPARSYIEKAEEVGADIIAASAILTTTMVYMPDLSRVLNELGQRDKFKILLGGGPVTTEFAKEADADGYAENAGEGVQVAKGLVQESGKGGSK